MRWNWWGRWIRRRSDDDFAAEVESHIAMETERLVRGGMSPARRGIRGAPRVRKSDRRARAACTTPGPRRDSNGSRRTFATDCARCAAIRRSRRSPSRRSPSASAPTRRCSARSTRCSFARRRTCSTPRSHSPRLFRRAGTGRQRGTVFADGLRDLRGAARSRDGFRGRRRVLEEHCLERTRRRRAPARRRARDAECVHDARRPARARPLLRGRPRSATNTVTSPFSATTPGRSGSAASPTYSDAPSTFPARRTSSSGIAPAGFTGVDLDRVDLWLPIGAAKTFMGCDIARSDQQQLLAVRSSPRFADSVSVETSRERGHGGPIATSTATSRDSMKRSRKSRAVLGPVVAARGPAASDDAQSLGLGGGGLAARAADRLRERREPPAASRPHALARDRAAALARCVARAPRATGARRGRSPGSRRRCVRARSRTLERDGDARVPASARTRIERARSRDFSRSRRWSRSAPGILASLVPAFVTARRDVAPLLGGGRAAADRIGCAFSEC